MNNLKPFNLEEYLKNPSKKVVTRNGRNVRIICTDMLCTDYPICALINVDGEEIFHSYTIYEKLGSADDSYEDLYFVPEKKKGWINIYKNNFVDNCIFQEKDEAMRCICKEKEYVTTIKIEWEE